MEEFNPIAETDLEFLCNLVFDYLNGKINPNIKASGLILKPRRMCCAIEEHKHVNVGAQVGNMVLIDQNYVNDMLDLWGVKNAGAWESKWPKSSIIETVAHELSHIEQKYDPFKYITSEEYRDYVEGSNTYRTFKWLEDNIDELQKVFGELDIEYIKKQNIYMDTISDISEYQYIHCDNYNMKLLELLKRITFHDIEELFEEAETRGFEGFGLFDWDQEDRYIYDFGSFDTLKTDPNLAYTASTYLTTKILGSGKCCMLTWGATVDNKTIELTFKHLGNFPSYLLGYGDWSFYENRADKQLEFCKKYYRSDIRKYGGFVS